MRLQRLLPSSLTSMIFGTGIAQIIAFASSPFLARLYSNVEFGTFATINAWVLTIGTLSAFRWELAIPVPLDQAESNEVAWLGIWASLITGMASAALLLISKAGLLGKQFIPDLGPVDLFCIPIILAALGFFATLSQAAVRRRMYKVIARRAALQSGAVVAAQVSFGFMKLGFTGLLLGLAVGQLVSVFSLWLSLRKAIGRPTGGIGAAAKLARHYSSFPLIMGPSGAMNAFGIQLPLLLVAALHGPEEAGGLAMAMKILSSPLALVGVAISSVYMGELNSLGGRTKSVLRRRFMRSSAALLLTGLLLSVVLFAAGPRLFSVILGAQWEESGAFAQGWALATAAQLVATPLSQTLTVLNRLKWQVLWDISRLVTLSLAGYTCLRLSTSPLQTIWILGMTSFLLYLASWLLSFIAIRTAATKTDTDALVDYKSQRTLEP